MVWNTIALGLRDIELLLGETIHFMPGVCVHSVNNRVGTSIDNTENCKIMPVYVERYQIAVHLNNPK